MFLFKKTDDFTKISLTHAVLHGEWQLSILLHVDYSQIQLVIQGLLPEPMIVGIYL